MQMLGVERGGGRGEKKQREKKDNERENLLVEMLLMKQHKQQLGQTTFSLESVQISFD